MKSFVCKVLYLCLPHNQLKEHGSKITDAEKKAIEDASSVLKEALKGSDNEDIKKKTETLVQASMKLGEAIYKSQQGSKPGDAPKDILEERQKELMYLDSIQLWKFLEE